MRVRRSQALRHASIPTLLLSLAVGALSVGFGGCGNDDVCAGILSCAPTQAEADRENAEKGTSPGDCGYAGVCPGYNLDASSDIPPWDAGSDTHTYDTGSDVTVSDAGSDAHTTDAAPDTHIYDVGVDVAAGDASTDTHAKDATKDVAHGDGASDAETNESAVDAPATDSDSGLAPD